MAVEPKNTAAPSHPSRFPRHRRSASASPQDILILAPHQHLPRILRFGEIQNSCGSPHRVLLVIRQILPHRSSLPLLGILCSTPPRRTQNSRGARRPCRLAGKTRVHLTPTHRVKGNIESLCAVNIRPEALFVQRAKRTKFIVNKTIETVSTDPTKSRKLSLVR